MAKSHRVPSILSKLASKSQSSPYVCRRCLRQVQYLPKPTGHQVRYATTPLTEKIRRKIWGTDNPPGLADPYGPSFRERRQMALEEQAERERRAGLTPEEIGKEDGIDGRRMADERLEMDVRRQNIVDRDFDQPFEDDPEMEEEAPAAVEDEEYKPAMTWDGLEHIGHREGWKHLKPKPADHYKPWMTSRLERPWTREELVQFLHQAIAEAQGETPAEHDRGSPEASTEAESLDETFLNTTLDFADPRTFQILKTFQCLTSIRIPDPALNSIFKSSSLASPNPSSSSSDQAPLQQLLVLTLEAQKPKPKNLYERLMEKQHLAGLGNILVLNRRETSVDKEKEVGRWKVIERELRDRGLPVLGRLEK